MKNQIPITFLLFILICFISFTAQAQTGKIVGKVIDQESGSGLPGVNLSIKGTSMGAASNFDGDYIILNVPVGRYKLIARYIGYNNVVSDVKVLNNKRTELNIEMTPTILEGETVSITAQAEGQMQAMNQQLSAKTIKNIVSKKQIQDLPEANAAEAVGRLPGVSLERSGGEGNKVVIRGMAAKYSLVQIDGVNVAATGEGDRSADLSMISPYMLEGIELTKSIMANQEATATGGIVNFRIKKAPDAPTFNVITQGGMNSLRNTYKDYKLSIGGSNRFYMNLFGVFAQVDYEKKDAGSHQLGGVDVEEDEEEKVRTKSMELMDIFRNVQRIGGVLVLDYSLPSTTIKLSNFFSRIKREETSYKNNYNFGENRFTISYDDTPESWLTVLTNSLQIEHRWGNWEINSAFSHSYSENKLPYKISSTNGGDFPIRPFGTDRNSDFNVNLDPGTIPDLFLPSMNDAVHNMRLDVINHEESDTQERDLAGELNVAYTFNFSNQVNVKLSMGGKVKHKSKEYDKTAFDILNEGLMKLAHDNFEISQRNKDYYALDPRNIYLEDFLTKNDDSGDFLDSRYTFSSVFDKEKFRRLHDLAMAEYDDSIHSLYTMIQLDFSGSNYNDYHGTEDYHAFYLMPEINIGPQLLFVPGVRYEANRTEYTGYRGSRQGVQRPYTPTPIDTVTKVRENQFWLPMIQAFYKPTYWLTVKAGYTHTLQRPNYDNIMPSWMLGQKGEIISLSNFRLKPELSKNWDIQFSFHSNEIGLLSVGAFHKKITDMIFWTGNKVITDTAFFELPTSTYRKPAAYATNNENSAYNYGFEFEWQSNFWYLPGFLKDIVLNVNYTRNISEAKYLKTNIDVDIDPVTYESILINKDTTYASPMIQQPDHLLNLTLGYDYKGFSIRWAMRYKSHIFKDVNWYEKLRGYSTNFYRFDVQVRQKLPVDGLEFFLNVNNLTGEVERNVINYMDFAKYIEDYGRNANMGLRYQL